MKALMALMTVCGGIVLVTACHKSDNNNNNTNLPNFDQIFLDQTSRANLAEQDAGTLAVAQAMDTSVKAFGQQMIDEHGQAENDLKNVAAGYKYTSLPTAADSAHILIKDSLMTLSGMAFDTAYIAQQIADHQHTVAVFLAEVQGGTGAAKDYAVKYLPHIQDHLAKADSIMTHLKQQ